MADSIAQLSFELSAKALEEQERTLAGLRACAGTVIASGSVAASFLGSAARRGLLDALGALAMVAFVICLGSAIWVLMPHDLVFAFQGEDVMAEGRQTGPSGPRVPTASLVFGFDATFGRTAASSPHSPAC
jgi:hypothetical protein